MTLHWGDDALAVPCPRCDATAGNRCRNLRYPGQENRTIHIDRCRARLRVGNDEALDVLARHLARGHSHAAIGSMYGTDERSVEWVATEVSAGRRPRVNERLRALLLAGPTGPATAGYVSTLATMRRLRALARMGHGVTSVSNETGIPTGTLSEIQSGRQRRMLAVVAAGVQYAYERLEPGRSAQTAGAAYGAGWAPRSAWDGLDMDDPDVRPDGYPKCDRPHVLRRHLRGTGRYPLTAPTDARLATASTAARAANEAAPGAGHTGRGKGLREGGRPETMMTDATDNLNGAAPTSRRSA